MMTQKNFTLNIFNRNFYTIIIYLFHLIMLFDDVKFNSIIFKFFCSLSIFNRQQLAIPLEKDGSFSKCTMYAVNFTEILQQQNANEIDRTKWPIKPCTNGWEYNFTEIPYSTVATENDWVCENSYLPTLSTSIFFVGAIVGGLLFG